DSSTSTIKAGTDGVIAYDAAGNRASRTLNPVTLHWTDPETHHVWTYHEQDVESYVYTADGYLAEVDMNRDYYANLQQGEMLPDTLPSQEGTFAEAKYVRDAMGRVTSYSEYDTTSATPTNAVYSRTATYNNKSQVTDDSVTVVRTDGTWVSNTHYD